MKNTTATAATYREIEIKPTAMQRMFARYWKLRQALTRPLRIALMKRKAQAERGCLIVKPYEL